jgi:hypothetical protein
MAKFWRESIGIRSRPALAARRRLLREVDGLNDAVTDANFGEGSAVGDIGPEFLAGGGEAGDAGVWFGEGGADGGGIADGYVAE